MSDVGEEEGRHYSRSRFNTLVDQQLLEEKEATDGTSLLPSPLSTQQPAAMLSPAYEQVHRQDSSHHSSLIANNLPGLFKSGDVQNCRGRAVSMPCDMYHSLSLRG